MPPDHHHHYHLHLHPRCHMGSFIHCSKNTHIIITDSDGSLTPWKKRRKTRSVGESDTNKVFFKQRNMKSKWRVALLISRTRRWPPYLWFEVKLCDIPFCSVSCHWECEQQRAAWIHKYKLEGCIYQSSKACTPLHLRVPSTPLSSCLTAVWTTESRGLWSA